MAAPSLTVLLPRCNVAPFLPACLHPLPAQTGANQGASGAKDAGIDMATTESVMLLLDGGDLVSDSVAWRP